MKPHPSRPWLAVVGLLLVMAGAGVLAWASIALLGRDRGVGTPVVASPLRATLTEPILPPPPTATSVRQSSAESSAQPIPQETPGGPGVVLPPSTAAGTPEPAATRVGAASAMATPRPPTDLPAGLYGLRQRLGVGVATLPITEETAAQLGVGWYQDWTASSDGFRGAAVEYVPTIRLRGGVPSPNGAALLAAVDSLPGALWLIGNEPDVRWQDNVAPADYARLYHDLYALLKERDPTCTVAIGGISQSTPLRLRYLDAILEAYRARYGEPMPVDVWNVHNFILHEERDSWGVDIPPSLPDRIGVQREVADHDDMAIFQEQIVAFRRWMQARGQQDKPLIVSEYGVLMPAEYGFPAQRVERFLHSTFEFFRTATDSSLGYPADGYRLVQRWCWFSLADARYPTGNLVAMDTGELTALGRAFGEVAGSQR